MALSRRFDVALCGYYGFGNLGDELLAKAAVSLLEDCGTPRERIVVLSKDPETTTRELGTSSAYRWSLRAVYEALSESESLLLGGGGLFQDSTSVRSSAYYWAVVRLAGMAHCRPWCFGQSVGPFRGKIAPLFARDALRACERRVVRDRVSLERLRQWGLGASLAPDLVFGLDLFRSERPARPGTLLLNIRPWGGGLPESLAAEVESFASRKGLAIRGIAMAEEDAQIMGDLARKGVIGLSGIDRALSPEDCANFWPLECAGAVGMRLHFCILTVLAGIPLLPVPYDPKVSGLAESLGLETWKGTGPILLNPNESMSKLTLMKEQLREAFTEAYQYLRER